MDIDTTSKFSIRAFLQRQIKTKCCELFTHFKDTFQLFYDGHVTVHMMQNDITEYNYKKAREFQL